MQHLVLDPDDQNGSFSSISRFSGDQKLWSSSTSRSQLIKSYGFPVFQVSRLSEVVVFQYFQGPRLSTVVVSQYFKVLNVGCVEIVDMVI